MFAFTIWIDKNGYYSTEDKGITVEVFTMPQVENVKYLLAYKYDSIAKTLLLDEKKLEQIKSDIEKEVKLPTTEERLADLENAFLEFTSKMLNGGI